MRMLRFSSLAPKDSLPSPPHRAFVSVTTTYTLADPGMPLAATPMPGKRWVPWSRRDLTGDGPASHHQLRQSGVSPCSSSVVLRCPVRSLSPGDDGWLGSAGITESDGLSVIVVGASHLPIPGQSAAALQLSLRRGGTPTRLRTGLQAIQLSPCTTDTDAQVLESFPLGRLFRHATLPRRLRGFQAITGRDKPDGSRRIPALLGD